MIYFVRSAGGGPVKIGTTIRLSERLDQLRKEVRPDLQVMAVLVGGRAEEKSLHSRFSHLKLRPVHQCEWFEPGEDLIEFMAKHGQSWDGSDDEPPVRHKNIVVVQGTEEWKAWLDSLALANNAPITVTIEQALREMSDRLKHKKPPRRTP